MRLTGNKYFVLLGLLMILEISNASAPVRRRRSDSSSSSSSEEGGGGSGGGGSGGGGSGDNGGIIGTTQNVVEKIPLLGGPLSSGIQKGVDGWHYSQDLTNGAIGRVLGGAFPCTLDLDSFRCSGVSTTSDISDLIESILDPIPWVMLPGPFKSLIVFLVDASWAPFMDLLFGGVKQ
ncbi:uncharacterized protein LOC107036391 [Diachasma alloeum]|uniref:uncharacterized protein LOC107036391 n=1 Tax=Diachasma alloeum TaxID=454923 RepID=UPI0007383E42|nr:uncharacterized protein LOC107036391 [Diachasma alloeum]